MVTITSLGGFGNVTRNMYCYEQGDDILLVDCGIGFPTEEMLGIDLLIPDISYLKGKEKNIRGLILTHGHEDHIGGLPYILPQLPSFPIYGAKLTSALAQNKLEEHRINRKLEVIDSNSVVQAGSFKITFARVSHSIPDTYHLMIETEHGIVYHGADFKFDLSPVDGIQPEMGRIGAAGNKGVTLLLSDCLGSERQGATPSEKTLDDMFDHELSRCKGKFIMTTMSSSISRLQQAISASVRHGRRVVLSGRSLEKNVTIAMKLGYLNVNPKMIVQMKHARKFKDNKLSYLVAGSQGQEGSALYRIAMGEHSSISIRPGDHVVFSTDYIPGSETAIHTAIDALYQQGATVTYADIKDGLHVSGHGSRLDLKMLINLTRPKYFLPIGGTVRHIIQYGLLAEQMGYDRKKVLMSDGRQVLIDDKGVKLGKKPGVRNVMVDGLGVGDVGNVVLRDRQVLAEEGVVVVLLKYDSEKKQLDEEPDIITRGLVYTKPNDTLLVEAKKLVHDALKKEKNLSDWRTMKNVTAKQLQNFFGRKLQRHPMILPIVIEV